MITAAKSLFSACCSIRLQWMAPTRPIRRLSSARAAVPRGARGDLVGAGNFARLVMMPSSRSSEPWRGVGSARKRA